MNFDLFLIGSAIALFGITVGFLVGAWFMAKYGCPRCEDFYEEDELEETSP